MSDDRKLPISGAFRLLGDYLADQDPGDADAGWLRLKAGLDDDEENWNAIREW